MIEISGRDQKEYYKTSKIMCNAEEEVITLIKEYNSIDLED
jgi:hypothetical protein